jgi:hypothetical protein
MSGDYEEFWSSLPEKVQHPHRVPVVEALWWIGEPLWAIALVDVLDGHISMWEAAHHLRVLEGLVVVERASGPMSGREGHEIFYIPYRLIALDAGDR